MSIQLVTENVSGAKIKVVGIGGAGGNAINNMIDKGLEGVDFIVLNTDIQDLDKNQAEIKIQIGRNTTAGLGTGMDDTKGYKAVEESREDIENALRGSDMVFITAGMGGGTGTGGAPAVAKIAKATGALVVGIATKPFEFEGDDRLRIADEGLRRLKQEVDSCIVIPNEKLLSIFGEDKTFGECFMKVDDVLYNATRGISDIITKRGKVNVDFADVKTIMRDMGDALMGIGSAKGDDKAIRATEDAINNPLLEGVTIKGAKSILLNIIADNSFKITELKKMTDLIKQSAGKYSKLIWGVVTDERLDDEVIVTIIATGFNNTEKAVYQEDLSNGNGMFLEDLNKILRKDPVITKIPTESYELAYYDIPTVQRKKMMSSDELKQLKAQNDFTDIDIDYNDDMKLDAEDKPAFLRRQMD